MSIRLTELNIYPIKSTRRVALDEAVVERQGLRGDRRWMLVDEGGTFISQRTEPRLALVQAHVDGAGMSIEAPDMPAIRMSLTWKFRDDSAGGRMPDGADDSGAHTTPDRASHTVAVTVAVAEQVRIFKDTVEAVEGPQDASEWFSRYLRHSVRLVRMNREDGRKVDPAFAVRADDHVSFADGYPLLLTSSESLADLNRRMDSPLPMTRFRPNLVVSGAAAFDEDEWHRIRIGDLVFDVVKGCARCAITTVDPETAHQGKEPLRTLNQFRQRDGNVYFGQNLIPAGEGTLRVGDTVEVLV